MTLRGAALRYPSSRQLHETILQVSAIQLAGLDATLTLAGHTRAPNYDLVVSLGAMKGAMSESLRKSLN